MKRPRLLLVDDEEYVRASLAEVLEAEGFDVTALAGAREALHWLEAHRADAIITDLRMPAGDGLLLLAEARKRGVPIPIVMITGVGTISEAVAAMKQGAFDFLQKPVEPAELVRAVQRAVEHQALKSEVSSLRKTLGRIRRAHAFLGGSAAMRAVREQIGKLAQDEGIVLIEGESGTGKDLAAEEIHMHGPRAAGPFVVVNCAAIAENSIETELFGSELRGHGGGARRVGRFEEAEGGTLVLDDIGALRPGAQSVLLRVLESGEYAPHGAARPRVADVRVIALARGELAALVRSKSFRPELYYRLEVHLLRLPPLHEHKDDIAEIALDTLGEGAPPLGAQALDVLSSYDWPGNVRELRNLLERARMAAGEDSIDADVLRSILEPVLARAQPKLGEFNLRRNVDERERETVIRALAQAGGVKRDASELLGIDARNFGYYLRKHKIRDGEWQIPR